MKMDNELKKEWLEDLNSENMNNVDIKLLLEYFNDIDSIDYLKDKYSDLRKVLNKMEDIVN
mgnify:CR=1 FL=1